MGEDGSTDEIGRLRELHHAATDLMASTDTTTVYETAVTTAETVLGFDFCSVFVRAADGYEVVASSHLETGSVLDVAGGVLEATFERGESSLTRDLTHSSTAAPTSDVFRSGISVPIGDRAVLQAVSRTPNAYDRTDLELAELLAIHAEAAIDAIRSRETIGEQKRRIARLHDVATEIGSCRTHEELFGLMRDASERILGFDWCSVYVLDDDRFVVAMASEASPVAVGERPFPEGKSKARDVLESGDSLLVEDVTEIEGAHPTSDRMRSALSVPVGDLGVFNAAHEEPGAFDAADVELAELLAGGVAEAYVRIDAQERLHRRKRELERQNERLDRFASTISHDIRNPLSVAIGYADLAATTGDPDAFERLHAAHDRMATMVEELLLLTRNDLSLDDAEPVPVAKHARAAWARVRTDGAELVVTLPEEYTVRAHPGLLSHVFENLLDNAVTHNDSPVAVTVGALEVQGSIRGFFVADDGDGVPPDVRETAFEHGSTTAADGTGFGLSIVEEFVEAHGWTIALVVGTDGGARFEIGVE